jgi:hypothetical protein
LFLPLMVNIELPVFVLTFNQIRRCARHRKCNDE